LLFQYEVGSSRLNDEGNAVKEEAQGVKQGVNDGD
jgi:hypothetical protein